ncbi:MAG TPA: serpin family protein [Feifaniaceae bacterium]|nr:serpin family protein [Feifaniaceae bacterium]
MEKKTRYLALALAAILLFALGCAAPQPIETPAPIDAAPVSAAPLTMPALDRAKPLLAPEYDGADTKKAGSGVNEFTLALMRKLYKKGENMVVSPFSVWLTLAALANATDQSALPQLLEALEVGDLTAEELNASVSRMLYELTGNEGGTYNPLAIANAVFVDESVTLKKEFAQQFLDYYRGTAMHVDMQSPEAIKAINDWASEHTNGLITDIVKEMPKDAIVALANAIYFSDRWKVEFDEAQTRDMTFHGAQKDVTVPFMLREGGAIPYYEDETLQAVDLAFKTGSGMYILLPKDGDADALIETMDAERFINIVSDTEPSTGKLLLPRFSLRSDFTLNDALEDLGVPLLNPADPKLTGLVEETDAFISASLHQATINVDEKGTTAAAVTVEIMERTSLPLPTEPFSMVCDRPFVFILYRWTPEGGEQALFTGVVNQL